VKVPFLVDFFEASNIIKLVGRMNYSLTFRAYLFASNSIFYKVEIIF